MHTAHIWRYLHIHRTKITVLIFSFFILFISFPAHSQATRRPSLYERHQPDYDERRLHYGFFLSGHYAKFNRRYSDAFVTGNDSTFAVSPVGSPGFGLGSIVSYQLNRFFDFRMLPAAAFNERSLQYRFVQGTEVSQLIESTFLELPLMIKYKSLRRGNLRMYMVGGVKPSVEIGSNRRERSLDRLRTNTTDLAVEYGFGFDLFYSFVKVSPELRFSHGLRNMLIRDTSPYSQALNRLTTHTVSLYLFFE
jgi:hypothetical protein